MKKIFKIILICVIGILGLVGLGGTFFYLKKNYNLISPAQTQIKTNVQITNQKKLIEINIYYNAYAGFLTTGDSDDNGIEAHILHKVFNAMKRKYNIKPKFINVEFNSILASVENDNKIAIGAGALSYKENNQFLHLNYGTFEYGTLINPQTDNEIAGVEVATMSEEILKNIQKTNKIEYKSYPSLYLLVDALQNKEIEYIFAEMPLLEKLKEKFNDYQIAKVPYSTNLGFVFNKKNKEFFMDFKKTLKRYLDQAQKVNQPKTNDIS